MKKYVLVKTGDEVKIGDILQRQKKVDTSFGMMEMVEKILVTKDIIPELIECGIIKVLEKKEKKTESNCNLGKIVADLAKKYDKPVKEVTDWLEATNAICPKAVLDILLDEIACKFYKDNPDAFEGVEEFYSLRAKDGKVGKVYNMNSYIPLFKSVEDAEIARTILKKQLDLMYGE